MSRIHMIGNAHLDPAWMWRMPEGLAAFSATCRSALDRMEETPDFIFTCSSAAHYEFVLQTDPALFERIQDAVQRGKWCLVGGWWVEPDCNLPSAEGFRRQGLLGQEFFQKHFGKIAKTGFCVDSFGHSQDLPQLMQEAGMENYIFMRPEEHEMQLDASLFWWEAPSGDRVLAYRIPLHYSNFARTVPQKLNDLKSYHAYNADQPWMIFYGVGNHGGGPTKEQINQIIQSQQALGPDEIVFSDPDRFFAETSKVQSLPVFRGELQPHAIGCYSAHSEIKRLNIKAENALIVAEKLGVNDKEALDQAWKNVCLNHFHDILGGVSIREACDDAMAMYNESISIAGRAGRVAAERLRVAKQQGNTHETLFVINPNDFEGPQPIEFELWHPHASERGEILESVTLRDGDGVDHPCQKIEPSGKIGEDRVRFVAVDRIPSMGHKSYRINREAAATKPAGSFDLPELCTVVYSDESDTWGHGILGYTEEIGEFEAVSDAIIESGPIRTRRRITRKFRSSTLEEDFIQYKGEEIVEHRVTLDWRERHAVLKLRYGHEVPEGIGCYETPCSYIERKYSSNEVPGQRWLAAFDNGRGHGLALITDSKSSYSIDQECINVTVARSPLYAHHVPPHVTKAGETLRWLDQGIQEFTNLIVPIGTGLDPVALSTLSSRLLRPLIVLA